MKIFEHNLEGLEPNADSVVTVGTFDGLHLGHRKLISRVTQSGSPSTVVTFYPHPQTVVARPGKNIQLLTPADEKVQGLQKLGVEKLIVLDFDRILMNMTAEDFLNDIIRKIGLKKMVVGHDHAFGKDRKGDKDFVVDQGKRLGFETEVVEPYYWKDRIVSSTLIRKTLYEGDVASAAEMLGTPYSFTGWVVRGDSRGASLGYPTANLKLDAEDKLLPLNGVYAVFTEINDIRFHSLLYIGNRPTYGAGDLTIEVFLMGFGGSLYGEKLKVFLIDRLRDDIKFSSEDELKTQLVLDEQKGKIILREFAKNTILQNIICKHR